MNARAWAAALLASVAMTAHAAATRDDLFNAVAIDDVRAVRRILDERIIDPKATDARGDTLLIAAVRSDAVRVARLLVADPATDVEATNAVGETAMMLAAYRDQKAVVAALVERGAEVNRRGWTALHYAASVDAREIVALLLEHSAYIDADSPNRTTPLMMAARGDHAEMCRLLVDAGADPTLVNERDLTAADFARRAQDDDVARWLDERSAAWRAKYGIPPPRSTPAR